MTAYEFRISDWSSDVCSSDLGGYTVLAVGTDVYPARVGRAFDDDILDITALAGQRAIDEGDDGFRIGALTTWSDLLRRPLPPAFAALKQAAREVGGVQIQNAGTLAGHLCNASPARSEEHTSELQSLMRTSYAVFCLKKKNKTQ